MTVLEVKVEPTPLGKNAYGYYVSHYDRVKRHLLGIAERSYSLNGPYREMGKIGSRYHAPDTYYITIWKRNWFGVKVYYDIARINFDTRHIQSFGRTRTAEDVALTLANISGETFTVEHYSDEIMKAWRD